MNLPLMEYWRELNSYSYEELSELTGVPCDIVQKIFAGQIKELDKEIWRVVITSSYVFVYAYKDKHIP